MPPDKSQQREHYLKKGRGQKTAAWILLGGGAALMTSAFIIGGKKEGTFNDVAAGAPVGGIGLLSAIGSIPFFIASGKNKRKAMAMVAGVGLQKNPALNLSGLSPTTRLAFAVKVGL